MDYRAPTVRKAFRILELLSKSEQSLTISDLSKHLRMGKSTVYGIATALEEAGALIRHAETKRYSLGLALLELGWAVYSRIDLKEVARPLMQELMAQTGQSVFLGTRSGRYVSIVDRVESTQDLKITAPIGTRIPLTAGATGKVFLAGMPNQEAIQLIRSEGLRPYTDKTVTDIEPYLQELKQVRRMGYALDREEYISGVCAVAAPIRLGAQRVWAIWVVGFTPSMNPKKMARLAEQTKQVSEQIGRRMHPGVSQNKDHLCP